MSKQTLKIDIPDGWILTDYRVPNQDEYYLDHNGSPSKCRRGTGRVPILERETHYREPTLGDQGKCVEVTDNLNGTWYKASYLCPALNNGHYTKSGHECTVWLYARIEVQD